MSAARLRIAALGAESKPASKPQLPVPVAPQSASCAGLMLCPLPCFPPPVCRNNRKVRKVKSARSMSSNSSPGWFWRHGCTQLCTPTQWETPPKDRGCATSQPRYLPASVFFLSSADFSPLIARKAPFPSSNQSGADFLQIIAPRPDRPPHHQALPFLH